MQNTYEFLLWSNCNFDCPFCWQRRSVNKDTIVFEYMRSIPCSQVESFLNDPNFIVGSNLHLSGGELFASRLDPAFEKLLVLVASKMLSGNINKLYLSTNLTYEPLDYIQSILDVLQSNNLLDRVELITSYDVTGRFTDSSKEQLMLSNLQSIRQTYPQMKVIVNSILTKQMCSAILDKKFSVKEFNILYGVNVVLLPYDILLDEYTPTNKILNETLLFVESENPGYLHFLYDYLDNDSRKITYEYISGNTQMFNKIEKIFGDCGHNITYRNCYPKKNNCFLCNLKKLA